MRTLGEVELRGIHRTRACASLYTYCVYELRMSEDAAYRRSKAARLVHRYPEVQGAIAKGEIPNKSPRFAAVFQLEGSYWIAGYSRF